MYEETTWSPNWENNPTWNCLSRPVRKADSLFCLKPRIIFQEAFGNADMVCLLFGVLCPVPWHTDSAK